MPGCLLRRAVADKHLTAPDRAFRLELLLWLCVIGSCPTPT
jgi:hypothetical protein